MPASDVVKLFKSRPYRLAAMVAIAADAIQILLLPLFAEGGLSPLDTLADIATAVILSRLLGWHWAFLPSMLAELTPGLDLFPTWTTAVVFVAWQRSRSSDPEVLPPDSPLPPRVLHR